MSATGYGSSPQLAEHSRLGGDVALSATLPLDDAGRVVDGGIRAQTARALERLRDAAARAGVSIERAAAIHVYLRDAADFAAMNEAYAPFFPVDPPTRTTVVARPADPAALVAIAATIVPDDQPREVVHPAGWKRSAHPYSYAIRSGDTLWLSGLVSRRGSDGTAVDGDVDVQTRVIVENARDLLAAGRILFRRRRRRPRVHHRGRGLRRDERRLPPGLRRNAAAGARHRRRRPDASGAARRDHLRRRP